MQRDTKLVEEGRRGRLGRGLQGGTGTLKNRRVQSLGINKRAYKQDGGKLRVESSDQGDRLGQGGKACK